MPYESTVPAITPMQHASETCLATPEGRRGFRRAIFSCWLGTTMEYADFALYGLAAGIIFADVFFPETAPMIALLASFATYSVGFIARPIGALMFGWLGDRKGRKFVMLMTVTLMGISTTLIGLIPGYTLIGIWAPICLVTLSYTGIRGRSGVIWWYCYIGRVCTASTTWFSFIYYCSWL